MNFFRRKILLLATIPLLGARIACAEPAANALPSGFSTADQVSTPLATGTTMTIEQQSTRAVIDWQSFDIGRDAHVDFKQPENGITVNRVSGSGSDPTQIYGRLTANGTVFILDRNGVIFGKTARVDTASLVVSTGLLAGTAANRITLENVDANHGGFIENHGVITVADGGLAAFVAPSVRNSGIIRAQLGTVTLASGRTVTLDMYGDGLWSVAVPQELAQGIALLDNSGTLAADGGQIHLSVRAAQGAANAAINNTGLLSAQRFSRRDGKIILDGGGQPQTLVNAMKAGTDADLQSALDSAAEDGSSTLHLQGGVYAASLSITRPIAVAGDTGATARIVSSSSAPVLTITADNVSLRYLHIVGGILATGAGNLHVAGNLFTQSGAAAISLLHTTDARVSGNTFFFSGAGGPVSSKGTGGTVLSDNVYLGSGDYGIRSDGDAASHLAGNLFLGDYAKPLLLLQKDAINDSRLIFRPPDVAATTAGRDAPVIVFADPAALAALAPAAGDACTGNTDDCP